MKKFFNKKTLIYLILSVLGIVVIYLVLSIFIAKMSFGKAINNMIYHLKDNNYGYEFSFDVTTSGNIKYEGLNNANVHGSYISNGDYILKLDYTSGYQETVNLNLYSNNDKTYIYDSHIYSDVIAIDKRINLSDLTSNVSSILDKLKGKDIKVKSKIEKGKNVISFKIDESYYDILDGISYPYSEFKDEVWDFIKDSNVKLYTSLLSGKCHKIEIQNDNFISFEFGKNTDINVMTKNYIYKINVDKEKIIYTKNKGTNELARAEITYKIKPIKELNMENISNYVSIDEASKYMIKNELNKSKTYKELFEIYYDIKKETNILDMYVGDEKTVYYHVLDGYHKNYDGKNIKKYIKVDQILAYSIHKFNQNEMYSYLNDIYSADVDSGYYRYTNKSETNELEHNNKKYYYQIINRSYDFVYSDFDDTKSSLYIWTEIDPNIQFLIEYQFDGKDITNDKIIKLLDIEYN